MSAVRPNQPPAPAPVRRRRVLRFLGIAALAGLVTAAGWYGARHFIRSADRDAALRQARDGSGDEALAPLLRLYHRDPDDAEVVAAIVEVQVRSGRRVAEVEPYVDRLVALRPDDPAARRLRFVVRRRLDKRAEALEDALRLLELTPDDHNNRRAVVAVAADVGRSDLAEREIAALLADRPDDRVELGTLLARVYLDAGSPDRAADALARYVPEDTTFAPARVIRGVLHYEAGRYESAVAGLRGPAAADTPDGTFARYYLALSLARLGKKDESDALFERLGAGFRADRFRADAAQQLESMPAQVRAADALLANDKADEARYLLETALARLGPDRAALATLARCYDALRRPREADEARRRAAVAPSH